MVKNILIVMYSLMMIFSQPMQISEHQSDDIPSNAIRLRILANSDSAFDQQIKVLVRDQVNNYVASMISGLRDKQSVREAINHHLPEIEQVVEDTLRLNEVNYHYTVDYRSDVVFPDKVYGDKHYPSGEYEAVLIKLGEGVGRNWWCVLFPPLCYLNVSSDDESDEVLEESVTEEANEEEADYLTDRLIASEADDALQEEKHETKITVKSFFLEWFKRS